MKHLRKRAEVMKHLRKMAEVMKHLRKWAELDEVRGKECTNVRSHAHSLLLLSHNLHGST